MRFGLVLVALCGVALGGCIRSVTIPPQEAGLKEACHGKDRPMAGSGGFSVWRCGEGDKAKYAVYQNGALAKEVNELEASQFAAIFACGNRGLKLNTPEMTACAQQAGSSALAATATLRDRENAEAEERRQRAGDAMIAAGAAISAAGAASQPQTVRLQANCTTTQVGTFANTNCY
ncbi:hypothetical protein [Methylobacterium sp.]|uniref:hypothetical protein n=1 Tax=Methylobacterium sp. TaxID=409 RepID=UPI0025EC33D3|nr:hypothetical protein [Methylobacterium sp.]MBY0258544.1 hypothetical protein [Methylobacterium sp.]